MTNPISAQEVIKSLGLELLPHEGGYYRETYRSKDSVSLERFGKPKACGTVIYFLITPDQFSAIHRLTTDEIWHFYLGDPVDQVRFHEDGHVEEFVMGQDILAQPPQMVQTLVPADVWQGSRLRPGGKFALLGTTMAPGFDFEDLELAERQDFCRKYPMHQDLIESFTHESE